MLKKTTGVFGIFCVATGTMISSGLFVLPALVYIKAGPSIIIAYLFSALLVIPTMLSKSELATAMPKSGGTYFFVHRSLGAFVGTFAGFASWFSLGLKSAFALLGIGLLIEPLLNNSSPELIKFIAVGMVLFFTILNIIGTKESTLFQTIMVIGLISILIIYIFFGFNHVDVHKYVPFMPNGWNSVFTVMGIIFISYGGLTKVASIAGEVKNPKRNLPTGMISAFIVTTVLYVLAIFITVGLLDKFEFNQTLNPLALGSSKFFGSSGFWILSAAAIIAFITTGNAGLLTSSRIPMAMSEDSLIPSMFARISVKLKTPIISILITSVFMITAIVFLDLENLVKVASTMKLILFALVNVSVILMRESKIVSYKPSFKSPLYPYIQIFGIIVYLFLIIEMGLLPFIITLGFFVLSLLWYFLYSKRRNQKKSALLKIVERITSREIKSSILTNELRDILLERDGIIEDKFDGIIRNAIFIDSKEKLNRKGLFKLLAQGHSKKLNIPSEKLYKLYLKEKENFESIYEGLAISNIVFEGSSQFDIVVVRSKQGIDFGEGNEPAHIVFALAGTQDERSFYLQALMAIAQIVQNKEFIKNWKKAYSISDLKNLILLAERIRKGKI